MRRLCQILFLTLSLSCAFASSFKDCKRCADNVEMVPLFEKRLKQASPGPNLLIPKKIHQIWLGGPLPEKFEAFCETWKTHHPDWEYKLWTDEDLPDFHFVTGNKINQSQNWAQKSDILRLEILNRYGGLYVDVDFMCFKPHDVLHYQSDFYAGLENRVIANALIAAAPNHPIIRTFLQIIEMTKKLHPHIDIVQQQTGPDMFTRIVNLQFPKCKHSVIYPCSYFFPIHCCGAFRNTFWGKNMDMQLINKHIKKSTYAAHLWAGTGGINRKLWHDLD